MIGSNSVNWEKAVAVTVAVAVCHTKAGLSHFESTVTKSDIIRQSDWTNSRQFEVFEGKPASFFSEYVESQLSLQAQGYFFPGT